MKNILLCRQFKNCKQTILSISSFIMLFILSFFNSNLYSQEALRHAGSSQVAFNDARKTHDDPWVVIDTKKIRTDQGTVTYTMSEMPFNIGANIDQLRNGGIGNTPTPDNWVNGNAGPENSHFIESWSIPYRVEVTGLTAGTHIVQIQWDIMSTSGSKHALDYITHYQNLGTNAFHTQLFGHPVEIVNPIIGKSYSGSPTTMAIPAPYSGSPNAATSSFNTLNLKNMSMWGGTITGMSYLNEGSFTNGAFSTLQITFTTTGTSVLFSWGGHIAAQTDWGIGNSASDINGSPYHSRVLMVDQSSIGNQDRSLKASAVVVPPLSQVNPQALCAGGSQVIVTASLLNESAAVTTYAWSLVNNTTGGSMSGTTSGNIAGGSTTVPSLTVNTPAGGFVGGTSFTARLTTSRTFTGVVFTNTADALISFASTSLSVSANPTTIDLAVGNTSQLTATTADNSLYTFAWTQTPTSGGSLNSTSISNPVFTATQAGDYKFVVTIIEIAPPHCTNKDSVVVSVVASAPPCGVTGPSPVCPSTTNNYKYDPNSSGTSSAIPANYTASWSLLNNTNGATLSGSTTGNSVNVIGGATCSTSYTVRITLTSTSGLIVVHCDKVVSVNVSAPPVIDNCPTDVTVQCIGDTAASVTGVMTAHGSCGVTIGHINNVQSGCVTIITRTWTATDPCGNTATCIQHINVIDRTAPVITCHGYPNDATATDNCTGSVTIYHRDDGGTRTWTAIDASGNTATCSEALPVANPIVPASAGNNNNNGNAASSSENTVVSKPIITSESGLQIQAYPNPFSVDVTFQFVSKTSGQGLLEIYNLTGQKIAVIFNGKVSAGIPYTVKYKGTFGATNALVYRLLVDGKSETGKVFQGDK